MSTADIPRTQMPRAGRRGSEASVARPTDHQPVKGHDWLFVAVGTSDIERPHLVVVVGHRSPVEIGVSQGAAGLTAAIAAA